MFGLISDKTLLNYWQRLAFTTNPAHRRNLTSGLLPRNLTLAAPLTFGALLTWFPVVPLLNEPFVFASLSTFALLTERPLTPHQNAY
jgi:hypothetical protein